MTCASCVNRIERFLTKTPGVERGRREPRDGAGDGPRRSRRSPAATSWCGPSRRPATRSGPRRPAAERGGRRAALDAELADEDRGARARAAPDAHPGGRLDRAPRSCSWPLMFWPQTRIAMEDINRLILCRRRSSSSGPAAGSTGPRGGPAATAARRWTRWSPSGRPPPGLLRVRHAVARGRPRGRARSPETYFDSVDDHHRPRSCSAAGSRPARRAARPARSGGSSASRRRPPGGSATASRRTSTLGDRRRRRPAARPARRQGARSTASSSRARRRSTSRCSPASRCPSTKRPGDEVIGATAQHDRLVRDARDPRRAATRPSPGSSSSSSAPRARRRRSSASPTGSARCSSRRCSSWRRVTFVVWFAVRARSRGSRSRSRRSSGS